MLIAAAPMIGGLAMKFMHSRKHKKSEASTARPAVEPNVTVTETPARADNDVHPAAMTQRYDHRTQEDRLTDADEDAVIDQPVQPGAAELRAEVAEAEKNGDLENDPSGPPKNE